MVRNVIGVMIGLVVAFLIVMGIESMNYMLFPIPETIDQNNSEEMKAYILQLPAAAFIIVLAAHFFGAMGGAWVACKIADSHQKELSIGIGTFLLIMGLLITLQVPHPIWFTIVDLLIYIPSALLGYYIFKR